MAFTGIQATVDFYTMQEAELTNQMTDIMTALTRASKQTSEIAQQTEQEKVAAKDQYGSGTEEYQDAVSDIQNDYQLKLAQITSWESELETKKDALETELKATTSYKESFKSVLKTNIQNDFKYGDTSSTTS